jgi:cell division protease FtsH
MALGLTQQVPIDDRHTYTREFLGNNLAILFGGRVAEELCLQHMTTGAGNDLERATELARKMVCEWGMSEKLGPMTFGKKEEQIFLGRDFTQLQDYSDGTADEIDKEVRRLIQDAYDRAKDLLTTNLPVLHRMAEVLLEKESLDGMEIDEIIKQFGAAGDGKAPEPVAAAAS